MGRVVVWGSINQDVQIEVTQFPRPGETVRAVGLSIGLGGKGANQAVAASLAGADTLLGGSVGCRDGLLEMLSLAAPELDLSHVEVHPEVSSGCAYIQLSRTGENQIVVVSGANECVSASQIPDFQPGDIVLAQMEIPADAVMRLFHSARAAGVMTVLNAAPATDEARRLFPYTDLLVVNETELCAFAGRKQLPDRYEDIAKVAINLLPTAKASVIVTLGADGAIVAEREGWSHVPGHTAKVVDTTGAGDCFCGVMCAALARGVILPVAVGQANAAASIQVERRGAAVAMPHLLEILARKDELT